MLHFNSVTKWVRKCPVCVTELWLNKPGPLRNALPFTGAKLRLQLWKTLSVRNTPPSLKHYQGHSADQVSANPCVPEKFTALLLLLATAGAAMDIGGLSVNARSCRIQHPMWVYPVLLLNPSLGKQGCHIILKCTQKVMLQAYIQPE